MPQSVKDSRELPLGETADIQIDREDIILLLLEAAERVLGWRSFSGVTRLEKLIFLLDKETDFEHIGGSFVFKPHNFGPFSKEVYEAIDFLEGCDLIEVTNKSYPSYYANFEEVELLEEISESGESSEFKEYQTGATEKVFRLTDDGKKVAQALAGIVTQRNSNAMEQLEAILRRYGGLSLNQLIRYVYRRYPAMAEKSIHPEASKLDANY